MSEYWSINSSDRLVETKGSDEKPFNISGEPKVWAKLITKSEKMSTGRML